MALQRKGRDFVGLCPFHNDHRPSLAVSPTKRIFKCWACNVGGDALKFVQLSQRVEFREALRILAERAGISLGDDGAAREVSQEREELRRVLDWAVEHFRRNLAGPAGTPAREYAARRGLTPETVEGFGIGLAVDSWDDVVGAARRAGIAAGLLERSGLAGSNNGRLYDRFRHRLIFPIRDGLGRCVAFGGRALGDDPAKYLNSPESPLYSKSHVLYALDKAKSDISRQREAIVVEGYLDAILLHQVGFTNAVATLGTALTAGHLKAIRNLSDRVYLCFDRDEAGRLAADRAVEAALRHQMDVRVVIMGEGKDPADTVLAAGAEGFRPNLQSALDALEFKWRCTESEAADAGPAARRVAVERFIGFLAGLRESGAVDPLSLGVQIGRLSDLLAIPAGDLYERLTRARASARSEVSEEGAAEGSAYQAERAGLPVGLTVSVEELFGALLDAPGLLSEADDVLSRVSAHCGTWQRLYSLLGRLVEEHGGYSRESVLAACEDEALLDVVVRVLRGPSDEHGAAEVLCGAGRRIGHELELLGRERLARSLRADDTEAAPHERAFEELLSIGRRHHSVLPADRRSSPAAGG